MILNKKITQIVNNVFLIVKLVKIGFLKYITTQNKLPIKFDKALKHNKISKVRYPTPHTQIHNLLFLITYQNNTKCLI